ncbi:MAG: thermonuclease family protein [Paracoccaceae bacterium]
MKTSLIILLISGSLLMVPGCFPSNQERTANQAELNGPISHVLDGDTIQINQIAVRLRGITCDERGALAEAATARVKRLQGKIATCRLNRERNRDRNRLIGWCAVDDQDIEAMLVKAGLCGRCVRYDPEETYAALALQVDWTGMARSTPRGMRGGRDGSLSGMIGT